MKNQDLGRHSDKFCAENAKGQLNSEWIYEVIVSLKMPTKNLKDFCPGSLLEGTVISVTT